MTPQELVASIAARNKDIEALKLLWADLFPDFPDPGKRQWQAWHGTYKFEGTAAGLQAVVAFLNKQPQAHAKHGALDLGRLLRYASGAMKNMRGPGDGR
jgi:hypothetical protein